MRIRAGDSRCESGGGFEVRITLSAEEVDDARITLSGEFLSEESSSGKSLSEESSSEESSSEESSSSSEESGTCEGGWVV